MLPSKTGPIPGVQPSPQPFYEPLLTRRQVVRNLRTITDKKFGELLAAGKIPVLDLGHRSKRFLESSVRKALAALEETK
jgi:hypothetical protein